MVLKLYFEVFIIYSRHFMHSHFLNTFCRQIQGHVQQMGLNLSSCGDDMVQFRRCLVASFFLNAATKEPDGTYRYPKDSACYLFPM
jgi:ATP-dependent RNA helicase DHX8/PRP22